MTLLEECLGLLGKKIEVLSKEETDTIFESMLKIFPTTPWGRIDWNEVNHKRLSSISEIKKYISEKKEVYILWDEASLPSIKTSISNLLSHIDNILAVSFDTWLYFPDDKCVIEFYHEGEITFGCKQG